MNDVPMPRYDEYFDRFRASPILQATVVPRLPVESSRGCCGEKNTTAHFVD